MFNYTIKMGWFNKKEVKQKEIPSLPELPRLPDFPEIRTNNSETPLPQLPSFPNNSVGQEFSQNTIKDAITDKKIKDNTFEENYNLGEFEHLKKPLTKEEDKFSEQTTQEITENFNSKNIPKKRLIRDSQKITEPLFIRIDKFEESLKIFEKLKKQISEIEKMLKDIKELRTEEEKELTSWENKIQATKEQIEKVDQDIFSKIK